MSAPPYGKIALLRPQQIKRRADARPVNPDHIERLAYSISNLGLQAPVVVRELTTDNAGTDRIFELVTGNHRYEAFQKLKWEEIPAVITEADNLHAELIAIDENLCREALTAAQEAGAVARRKELYEQLHPQAAHGGSRKSTRQNGDLKPERFTKLTAAATGRSERAIQRAATRGEKIGPAALKRITGTSLDKGGELDALAALSPADRKSFIERAAAGEPISVRSRSSAGITISSAEWRFKLTALMNEASTREDCEWAAEQARLSAARFYPNIPPFLDRRTADAK